MLSPGEKAVQELRVQKMSQKIWVIGEDNEKPFSNVQGSGSINASIQDKHPRQRNPAIAFSLSLFIWGCGQFYNGQRKLGFCFFLLMIQFFLFIGAGILYANSIKASLALLSVNTSVIFLICGLFYLCGLFIWYINTWQAYSRAVEINGNPFRGIRNTMLPVICSFLMPGWGQYLNGQRKKGLFFQSVSLAGLTVFPALLVIITVWPALEASGARLTVEWIFALCIIMSPVILVMWLLSIYDALKVNKHNLKKEPLSKRVGYAAKKFRYNIQIYGWKNVFLMFSKRIVLLILLLMFCAVSYHFFPEKFYMQQFQNLESRLSQKEMTVVPRLMKNVLTMVHSEE